MFVRVASLETVFAAMVDAHYEHVTARKRVSFGRACSLVCGGGGGGCYGRYHQRRFVSCERGYRDRRQQGEGRSLPLTTPAP